MFSSLGFVTCALDAQQAPGGAWLPARGYFAAPRASVREPALALRTLWSPLFRSRSAPAERPPFDVPGEGELDRELQGEAALGASVRLWSPVRWPGGGLSVGVQAGVFGRFRLEISSNDLVASDWVVGFPVEAARGPWSARLRLVHRSAHLGDELLEGGAQRVDFTSEALEALAAYRAGAVRLYGGGGVVTRSSLENEARLGARFSDDALLRIGADFEWLPWRDGRLGLEGGLDWQSADRTGWRGRVSAVLGLRARAGERAAELRGVFHDGPSPLGQFFLTDERYWGIELVLRLGAP